MEERILERKENGKDDLYYIFLWGALWGIFEATVGYLLHLISFSMSWLVWYPVACFFMANVYRITNKISSMIWVGILCSSIKLLNLMLPGRIDKVINPAISIVFEALAMAAIIYVFQRIKSRKSSNLLQNAGMILLMNTGWRLLYTVYLLFIVPDWIREVSVVADTGKFITFFIVQNLMTSILITIGYYFRSFLFKPIRSIEKKIDSSSNRIPLRLRPVIRSSTICILLAANIALDLFL